MESGRTSQIEQCGEAQEMEFVQEPKTSGTRNRVAVSEPHLLSPLSLTQQSGLKPEIDASQLAYMAKGPITRLFYGDLTLVADLRKYGMTADIPLSFRTVEDLVSHLEGWMKAHHSDGPPGSTRYIKRFVETTINFVKPIYFAATSQRVELKRFKISKEYMGWLLEDNNGSCMFVAAAPGNGGTWRGYYGWLGSNKGFSEETIAATRGSHASNDTKLTSALDEETEAERPECSRSSGAEGHCLSIGERIKGCHAVLSTPESIQDESPLSPFPDLEEDGFEGLQLKREHAARPVQVTSLRKRKAGTTPLDAIIFNKKTKSETHDFQQGTGSTINYHFFTSDKSLGAIPAKHNACNTFKKFFDNALSAMSLIQFRRKERDIIGVNVEYATLAWPLLVPWRDQASYHGMVEQLNSIAALGGEVVNVKVSVIMKGKI